jgi:RNA polymerase sigma-70 factor (ECF subfamily)
MLAGPDRETVIHEVFSRLIAREDVRRAFRGGSFPGWLSTVARNAAIDYKRRFAREQALSADAAAGAADAVRWEEATHARLLIERFRREVLPAEWANVFEHCVLGQMSQREAACALGLRRTTLAYREMRIRRALRRFLLEAVP